MNIIEVFIQLLAEHTEFVGDKNKRELHSDCLQAKNGFHILNGWGKVKIRIIFHDTWKIILKSCQVKFYRNMATFVFIYTLFMAAFAVPVQSWVVLMKTM